MTAAARAPCRRCLGSFLGSDSQTLFFQQLCHRRFHPAAGNETGGLQLQRSRHLFRRWLHGPMSHLQEQSGNPKPFITRITCSNLFVTGDDFIRQYFQVINWLKIY
jgi:hypothetical protein